MLGASAPALVELGPELCGSFGASCLASGLSYSFFSFAVDVAVSIHHDDAFHALMRCAFAGVISFMISHIFDLEFGLQGDRILFRIAQLLNATFLGGGHILLFMHSKSHLWTHSAIQSLLLESRASLTVLSLCEYLPSSHEELLAASSLECFQDMAGTCQHPGSSTSLLTILPDLLCQKICGRLGRMVSSTLSACPLTLDDLVHLCPLKKVGDLPIACQDGGGVRSRPDWSVPPKAASGIFASLRKEFLTFILRHGLHKRLRKHVADASESPFFSESEVAAFRDIANQWFVSQGCADTIDWSRPEGQPYCLRALSALSKLVKDADCHLFKSLLEGVSTGYDDDIPPSFGFQQDRRGCF